MSHLLALVDAYKDTHGQPSDASIARAIGVAPQTISSWRRRGIREIPRPETIRRLADFIGLTYADVFEAVAIDTRYLDAPTVQPQPPADPNEGEVRGA